MCSLAHAGAVVSSGRKRTRRYVDRADVDQVSCHPCAPLLQSASIAHQVATRVWAAAVLCARAAPTSHVLLCTHQCCSPAANPPSFCRPVGWPRPHLLRICVRCPRDRGGQAHPTLSNASATGTNDHSCVQRSSRKNAPCPSASRCSPSARTRTCPSATCPRCASRTSPAAATAARTSTASTASTWWASAARSAARTATGRRRRAGGTGRRRRASASRSYTAACSKWRAQITTTGPCERVRAGQGCPAAASRFQGPL